MEKFSYYSHIRTHRKSYQIVQNNREEKEIFHLSHLRIWWVSGININLHRFHSTLFCFLCFFDICTILFVYFSSASYCFHEEHSFIYLFIYFSSHIFSHLFPLSQRILQRFDEEGMLYLVPQGADDDWYWIYATVTDGREKTAYVVRMYAFCLFCMCVLCT